VTGCAVVGPDAIPPGDSAQFTAAAKYSDGSTRDFTTEAQWSVSDESLLSVTGAGQATGRAVGEAEVRATFAGSCTSDRGVVVLPAGRFLMFVDVTEDQVTAPLLGVRVEVVSGPAAGLAAATDWNGSARLMGVPQEAQLRLSNDGYDPVVQTVRVERQRAVVRLQMFPSRGRLDLPGIYRLTIASGSCAGGARLPEAVGTRTYTARLWNAGLKIHALLSGASFAAEPCSSCAEPRGNRFLGQTQALEARFTLGEYVPPEDGAGPWDIGVGVYPDVAERLGDGTLLSIAGQAIVTPTPAGFSGALDGTIAIDDSLPLFHAEPRVLASCRSIAHRFTLERSGSARLQRRPLPPPPRAAADRRARPPYQPR
jgi:hypothetical protein